MQMSCCCRCYVVIVSLTVVVPLVDKCANIVKPNCQAAAAAAVCYNCFAGNLHLPSLATPTSPESPLLLTLLQRLNYALQIEQRICRIALHFACVQHCELKCN